MKPIILKIVSYVLPMLMLFTILFDPTGVALGSSIITLPNFLLGTAEVIGNLVWLIGVLFLIVSIVFLVMIFVNDIIIKFIRETITENLKTGNIVTMTPYTLTDKTGNPVFKKVTFKGTFWRWCTISMAVIAIGSGFWFTGSMWLFATVTAFVYNVVGLEKAEEILSGMQHTANRNVYEVSNNE